MNVNSRNRSSLPGGDEFSGQCLRSVDEWLDVSHGDDRRAERRGSRSPSWLTASSRLLVLLTLLTGSLPAKTWSADLAALSVNWEQAGANRGELEKAWATVAAEERPGLKFLLEHMPAPDLQTLSADYLLENLSYAYRARREMPWGAQIPEEIFLNDVLPYASINERRDVWRKDFYERFKPMVAEAKTPGEAAVKLNQQIFPLLNVRYSTQRRRADQGPRETMESGLASCTGLSVLLVDACRAVGVPARLAGTPLWSDMSGNHTWVEVWDGDWHFTGAAEPSGDALNQAWFTGRAAKAVLDSPRHAIFATSFRDTGQHFPLVWARNNRSVPAVNVTSRYTRSEAKLPEGHHHVLFRLRDADSGDRREGELKVLRADGSVAFQGRTRDERFDKNDHLTAALPAGEEFTVEIAGQPPERFQVERDDQLIDLQWRETTAPAEAVQP